GGTFHPSPAVWACTRICCARSGKWRSNTHSPSSGTKRVEIYQRANSLRNLISNATDYVAAIRGPAVNHIREILQPEQVDNIRNMSRKVDSRRVEMRALTQARKSRRKHRMASVLKTFSCSLPTPATMPRSVHEHVNGFVLF